MSPEDAAARKALGVDQAIALWKLERLSGLMSLLNAARSKLMNPGMAVQLSTKEEEAHGYLRDAIYLLFDEQLAVEHQLYELLGIDPNIEYLDRFPGDQVEEETES